MLAGAVRGEPETFEDLVAIPAVRLPASLWAWLWPSLFLPPLCLWWVILSLHVHWAYFFPLILRIGSWQLFTFETGFSKVTMLSRPCMNLWSSHPILAGSGVKRMCRHVWLNSPCSRSACLSLCHGILASACTTCHLLVILDPYQRLRISPSSA